MPPDSHSALDRAHLDPAARVLPPEDRHRVGERITTLPDGSPSLPHQPPLQRAAMVPEPWQTNPLVGWWQRWVGRRRQRRERPRGPAHGATDWRTVGAHRRLVLLILVLAQSVAATAYMSSVLPYQGRDPLEIAILVVFGILFAWVSAGFWTALAGFWQLLRGRDRFSISGRTPIRDTITNDARTALVMPICNEDVTRVFAGLRATIESLQRSGQGDAFDCYILSDTFDPDLVVAEEAAWLALRRQLGRFDRVYYRRRRRRVKRKSGNIDDFCRRWGKAYRYMVVLDADSVMSGACLVRLVQLMEANPEAGIIQTAPVASGMHTLHARAQQFATRVYGPLFTAGLHYWQLGESHYWGHNAIIRMAPFMAHCALAPLPGKGAFAGAILSHDFVEAALMRRAGWGVWIAYDLPGSFEELPPNLLDELKRDQRWCHGNLMNFRLFFIEGMHPVHRAVFLTGVMSYLSAPLWFLFLLLSTVLLATHVLVEPQYFVQPHQLFPIWPQWQPLKALGLLAATAVLLFLPKILAVLRLMGAEAVHYGGRLRLLGSLLLETLVSMLMAPVRMLFHTRFIVAAFAGSQARWQSPARDNAGTRWSEALRAHGSQTLLGVVWTALVAYLNPSFLGWMLPILGAWMLAVPVSVLSSRVALRSGRRQSAWFGIPEERREPAVLRAMHRYLAAGRQRQQVGFDQVLSDPDLNRLARAMAPLRHPSRGAVKRARERWQQRLAQQPLAELSAAERLQVLDDPVLLDMAFQAVQRRGERSVCPASGNSLEPTTDAAAVEGAGPLVQPAGLVSRLARE